ncbi:phosphatase PAP2 family protein [Deinococcus cellulosilyticus]|uniref:Phosphatase PAP2 family protein n=1 Tax=Deinococcus cellulosilyticus (strain DSM 18568 / NBRC 106333 / KACC 11606 / 5516J-15) TaxID=1223518 RepID=A0A511N226_DEIC1|nr:phosphatase PAP2 family protein [Deinococcus cellulosilyticus]GEM46446.1 phosphatase PAP2 family protein [Deinococcus cellulosilyticus NBRC 106333 = KACC 11606]
MQLIEQLQSLFGGFESFWLIVTQFGNDMTFIALLALYYWLVSPSGGRQLGVWFGISLLVNTLIKDSLGYERPYDLKPEIASEAAKATGTGPGLPSGHAQMSATMWWIAATQIKKTWFWVLAVVLVLLIGLSRIVLGVHFPADVIGGLILGALFVLTAAFVQVPGLNMVARIITGVLGLGLALLIPSLALSFAVLSGALICSGKYEAPRTIGHKLGTALVGLLLVAIVYIGPKVILNDQMEHSAVGEFLRYFALVLVALAVVPRVMRFKPLQAEPAPALGTVVSGD